MKPYIIKQGDYLHRLAFMMGFDADVVWNDPANKALKDARPDPEVLCPGDVLFVPESSATSLPLHTGTNNRLAATIPTVSLDFRFADDDDKPFGNEAYVVSGLGREEQGATDADGHVKFDAPVTAREVHIVFLRLRLSYPVLLGNLDPIDEPSGVRMRLEQLGYEGWFLAGHSEQPAEIDAACDRCAIAAFQRDHKLAESGEMDAATRNALLDEHGV